MLHAPRLPISDSYTVQDVIDQIARVLPNSTASSDSIRPDFTDETKDGRWFQAFELYLVRPGYMTDLAKVFFFYTVAGGVACLSRLNCLYSRIGIRSIESDVTNICRHPPLIDNSDELWQELQLDDPPKELTTELGTTWRLRHYTIDESEDYTLLQIHAGVPDVTPTNPGGL